MGAGGVEVGADGGMVKEKWGEGGCLVIKVGF